MSPETQRDYACVSSLFRDIQRHLAIVSPLVLLNGDKCCVINFLKPHLLHYAVHHCDLSCLSPPPLSHVQLGRYQTIQTVRQRKRGKKTTWFERRKEKVIESEGKGRKHPTTGKRRGIQALLSPHLVHYQREQTTLCYRSFLIICL